MSLPGPSSGYALGPDEGEALWFNGGLGVLKASRELTDGAFGAMQLVAPKGFAAPLHIHRQEDEFFAVLDGEVRVQHGENVVEAVTGSVVYGPRGVPHSFHVDSDEARLLLFFGPGGVEGFFRDAGAVRRVEICRPEPRGLAVPRRFMPVSLSLRIVSEQAARLWFIV